MKFTKKIEIETSFNMKSDCLEYLKEESRSMLSSTFGLGINVHINEDDSFKITSGKNFSKMHYLIGEVKTKDDKIFIIGEIKVRMLTEVMVKYLFPFMIVLFMILGFVYGNEYFIGAIILCVTEIFNTLFVRYTHGFESEVRNFIGKSDTR